ncbi:MAG: DUF503 domain-containing protein [Chloroflexi bacterium]|nr:DUF503 domain-containing protein [Chloroflexota bacterium]
MHVAVCRITLRLAENHSLKEKRAVVRSLVQRVRNRFNVSVAEIDDNEAWQQAVLGVSCVSNDARNANQTLSHVLNFVEDVVRGQGEVIDCQTELSVGP